MQKKIRILMLRPVTPYDRIVEDDCWLRSPINCTACDKNLNCRHVRGEGR